MRAAPRRQRTQEAEHRLVSHSQNFRFYSAVRTGAECCDERVCVCPHGITCQNFTIFTHTVTRMLPVVVPQSSSGVVAIRCVYL